MTASKTDGVRFRCPIEKTRNYNVTKNVGKQVDCAGQARLPPHACSPLFPRIGRGRGRKSLTNGTLANPWSSNVLRMMAAFRVISQLVRARPHRVVA